MLRDCLVFVALLRKSFMFSFLFLKTLCGGNQVMSFAGCLLLQLRGGAEA